MAMGAQAGGHEGQGMEMKTLPLWQSALWVAFSFSVLLCALWITDRFVPLRFSGGG